MNNYDYGNWFLAILNIALFLYFIYGAFKPRTKIDWQTFRWFGAFIVALFAEMYGFPLTIYLLTSYFGNKFLGLDFSHNSGHILTTILSYKGDPHFSPEHITSYVLIFGGLILLGNAWSTLYSAYKKKQLATSGTYSYIRHPQYIAFILIIFGFLLQWPTLITLLMAPILIWRYIRLAKTEEQEMLKTFPKGYAAYMSATPGWVPSVRQVITGISQKTSVVKE